MILVGMSLFDLGLLAKGCRIFVDFIFNLLVIVLLFSIVINIFVIFIIIIFILIKSTSLYFFTL
jgi:hypothetical protein